MTTLADRIELIEPMGRCADSADRGHMNTATNQAVPLAVPRPPGRPAFRPDHPSALLNEIGVPVAAALGAAIRRHPSSTCPLPSSRTLSATTRLSNETGTPWSRDTPGEHGKSPTRLSPRKTAPVDYASPPVPRPVERPSRSRRLPYGQARCPRRSAGRESERVRGSPPCGGVSVAGERAGKGSTRP